MISRVRYKAASLCISYCWYHRENIRLLFTFETIFYRSQVHFPRASPWGSARAVRSGDQRHDQPLGRSARWAHKRRGSTLVMSKEFHAVSSRHFVWWTQDLARRATFPEGFDIREISAHIAVRVIEQAISEGLKVRRIQIWTLDTIHSIHG